MLGPQRFRTIVNRQQISAGIVKVADAQEGLHGLTGRIIEMCDSAAIFPMFDKSRIEGKWNIAGAVFAGFASKPRWRLLIRRRNRNTESCIGK
jgi:hypothetical protein